MMGDKLRVRLKEESDAKRLVETYRALKLSSTVSVEDIVLTEKTKDLLQVRASVRRARRSLLDESSSTAAQELLVIDLVERIVPRTLARPDGLEVVEWRIANADAPSNGTPSVKHAH